MDEISLGVVKVVAGIGVLVGGGELLLKGATAMASMLRISPLVIGLTVVAFGTSAPELAVSVQAALSGQADLSLGNVVGSNLFNILFILGLSAVIAPLIVSRQLIRWDVPVMIVTAVLLLLLSWDGQLGRVEGMILFGGLIVYMVWTLWQARRESSVQQESESREEVLPGSTRNLWTYLALVAAGLVLLSLGSRWLVNGSVVIATALGISRLIIGLTIVAVGTSLPEVMTSVLAVIHGQRDIAVGNVVGSNIFNILCVLGISALVSPQAIIVSSEALRFDIPAMLAVSVACLPIFLTGHRICRWEGVLFLFYYVMYISYLVLVAAEHEYTRPFALWMVLFVTPLAVVTISVAVYRHVTRAKRVLELDVDRSPGGM